MSSGSTYPRNTMAEQDMFHYPEFNTVATELHHTRCNDPSVDATFPYGSFMGRWFIHTRPYEGDNPLALAHYITIVTKLASKAAARQLAKVTKNLDSIPGNAVKGDKESKVTKTKTDCNTQGLQSQ